jgi:hypothetical protein
MPVAIRPGRREPSRGLPQAVNAQRKSGTPPAIEARQSWDRVEPPGSLARSVVTTKGRQGGETSWMEQRAAGLRGPAARVPRSRRREATSPDVSCLGGTWYPHGGLDAPGTLASERAHATAGGGRRKKRRPAAARHGACITRRIVPAGIPRQGAAVRLALAPKTVVQALQPGGTVRCSRRHTSLLVPWEPGRRLPGNASTGR